MENNFPSLREAAGAGQRGRQAPPMPSRGGPRDGGPPPPFGDHAGGGPGSQAGPPREQGFVAGVKDGYGFIRCAPPPGRVGIHAGEPAFG